MSRRNAASLVLLLSTLLALLAASPRAHATATPTQVAAEGKTSQVLVKWKACAGCVKYTVKRSTLDGGPYSTVAANVTGTSAPILGTNGTKYYFVVVALDALNVPSAQSAQVSATALAVPGGVQASADTSKVMLSWSPVTGATGYRIKRGTAPGGPYPTVLTSPSPSLTDTSVTQSTAFFYVVTATAPASESNPSAEVSATPLPAPPALTGLVATAGVGLVVFRWDAAANVVGAKVERSLDGTSGWTATPCTTISATSCHATGLAVGVPLFFRLRAVNVNGTASAQSPVLGPVTPISGWGAAQTGSLRLMNAAVQCRYTSDTVDDEIFYDMRLATRMARVASIVREQDPDVVVFEEAYRKECREALRDELEAVYPNLVSLPEADGYRSGGLMLFSKYPFEKFSGVDELDPVAIEGVTDGMSFDETTMFTVSTEAASWLDPEYIDGDDPMVAYQSYPTVMVRIRPPGGAAVNVAFTDFVNGYHYDDTCYAWQHQQERREQIEGIAKLLTEALTADQRSTEPVFLLGILDIDGNRAPGHPTIAWEPAPGLDVWGGGYECGSDPDFDVGEEMVPHSSFTHGEWQRVFANTVEAGEHFFGAANNCFVGACDESSTSFFTDAWGFEHPSAGDEADWGQNDLGQVNDVYLVDSDYYAGQTSAESWHPLTLQSGHRMDYLLHNQPVDKDHGPYLSATHLRRVFFFDPDGPPQHYAPAQYESFNGYVDPGSGTTDHDFPDQLAVSDHYFLVGDFLFSRPPRSNPIANDGVNGPTFGAELVAFDDEQDRRFDDITLDDPRQYAWFRLEEAGGTVTIGSSDTANVRVDVYHPTDLSTPLPSFHQVENCYDADGICGIVHDLPDPPYYVRYSLVEGAVAPVTFSAGFHLHKCSDPVVDYCVLPNGQERALVWPAGAANTPYHGTPAYTDETYWVAAVDKGDTDPPVELRIETADEQQFDLASTAPGDGAQLFPFGCGFDGALPDCGSMPCNQPHTNVGSWSATWDDADEDGLLEKTLDTGNESTAVLSPAAAGAPRLVLLRIKRSCTGSECLATQTNVTYQSRQYRVVPQKVRVLVENDFGANDDEVYMSIALDVGSAPGASSCDADPPPGIRLPYMDPASSSSDGETAGPETSDFGAYTTSAALTTYQESAYLTLCESDGDHPNDFLGEVHVTPTTPLGQQIDDTLIVGDVDSAYMLSYVVLGESLSAPVGQCP